MTVAWRLVCNWRHPDPPGRSSSSLTIPLPLLRHDFVELPIVESVIGDCGDKVWSQIIHLIY
jgi:hypothetical protein